MLTGSGAAATPAGRACAQCGERRGAVRAGLRLAKVRDLRVRVSGKGKSCAERGPGAIFYMHGDGAHAFLVVLST